MTRDADAEIRDLAKQGIHLDEATKRAYREAVAVQSLEPVVPIVNEMLIPKPAPEHRWQVRTPDDDIPKPVPKRKRK